MVGHTPLPVFATLSDLAAVDVAHGGDATYACSPDGRQWVRKRESNVGVQSLVAEAIGYVLSLQLGVPTPAAGLGNGQDPSWISELVRGADHWRPGLIRDVTNAPAFGGVWVVDWVLLNEDRHAGNVLFEPDHEDQAHAVDATAPRGRIWAIDSGNALVGWPEDYIARRADSPSVRNVARCLPIGEMRNNAGRVAAAAGTIDSVTLVANLNDVLRPLRVRLDGGVCEVLADRLASVSQRIGVYLDALEALT